MNRKPKKINFDLNFKFTADNENMACLICGLTGSPNRFDKQFQTEAVKYIPKSSAAIIGGNPQNFGLKRKPLSILGAENAASILNKLKKINKKHRATL